MIEVAHEAVNSVVQWQLFVACPSLDLAVLVFAKGSIITDVQVSCQVGSRKLMFSAKLYHLSPLLYSF